jgi:NADH dehydrogenase/NADH:ubiquinone oxidoreductase subunit G
MNIIIDGKTCEAEHGEFIIDIARRNNVNIPTLCHNEALSGLASCRICIVEILEDNQQKIVASCVYPITCEIEVKTHSEKITGMRRAIIKLLAASAPDNTYINKLTDEFGISNSGRFKLDHENACILCGLCVKACEAIGPCAISTVNRGINKKVAAPYDEPPVPCIGCGACSAVCPTGAIKVYENKGERIIWNKKLELLNCSKCGSGFDTQEQAVYLENKLGIEAYKPLCEKCRRAAASEVFKNIYGTAGIK